MDENFDEYLVKHFEQRLNKNRSFHPYTGVCPKIAEILNEISATDDRIIDVGCGYNYYKKLYPNLIGFDIVDNGKADIITSIKNAKFKKCSFDIALCLGVFQGSEKNILHDLKRVLSWVKPRGHIIMRCRTIPPRYLIGIEPLIWNMEVIQNISKLYNLELIDSYTEFVNTRIRWVWRKNV